MNALAIDPQTPSTLYAVTANAGVFKSTDGGGSWSRVLLSTYSVWGALAIDPVTPTTLYAGGQNGVAKSTDGGGDWSYINTGLSCPGCVYTLAIDPVTPTTIYAGTQALGGADAGRVFKSTNGGVSWSAFNTGLPNLSVWALAIDPQRPATLYAGTDGGVFVFNGATDLAITKGDSPDPVIAGTDVTYSVNVTNGGPSNAASVVVTDNLPPEVSFISCTSTGGGTCGGSGNNRTVPFARSPGGLRPRLQSWPTSTS